MSPSSSCPFALVIHHSRGSGCGGVDGSGDVGVGMGMDVNLSLRWKWNYWMEDWVE